MAGRSKSSEAQAQQKEGVSGIGGPSRCCHSEHGQQQESGERQELSLVEVGGEPLHDVGLHGGTSQGSERIDPDARTLRIEEACRAARQECQR